MYFVAVVQNDLQMGMLPSDSKLYGNSLPLAILHLCPPTYLPYSMHTHTAGYLPDMPEIISVHFIDRITFVNISVTWTDVSSIIKPIDWYLLEITLRSTRRTRNSPETSTVNVTDNSYVFTEFDLNGEYAFRVVGGNELGSGMFSEPNIFNVPEQIALLTGRGKPSPVPSAIPVGTGDESPSPSPLGVKGGLEGWIIGLIVLILVLLLGICCLICFICLCCFLLGRRKKRDYDPQQKGPVELIQLPIMWHSLSHQ